MIVVADKIGKISREWINKNIETRKTETMNKICVLVQTNLFNIIIVELPIV